MATCSLPGEVAGIASLLTFEMKRNSHRRIPRGAIASMLGSAALLCTSSCDGRRRDSSTTLSRDDYAMIAKGHRDAERVCRELEDNFEEDGFRFTPIFPAFEGAEDIPVQPSHLICKTRDGREVSEEDLQRIKAELRDRGHGNLGIMLWIRQSEQSAPD